MDELLNKEGPKPPATPGTPGGAPGAGVGAPGELPAVPRRRGAPTKAEREARKALGLSKPGDKPAAPGAPAADAGRASLPIPPAIWNEKNCAGIGRGLFLIPRVITAWKGWGLTDQEAAEVAAPLAVVLNEYFPAGGQYAGLTALGTTLLVIASMKSAEFVEWKKAQPKPEPKVEATPK